MIPEGAQGVGHLATRIVTETLPRAADDYMAADLGMIAGLLGMVAQDFDRAAEVMLADIEGAHAVFESAEPHFAGCDLGFRMAVEVTRPPGGMRLSQLTAHVDLAMRVLIDLHGAVEAAADAGEPWAEALDLAIWGFLDAHVARRRYDSAF